jgi:hypothetical protein
MLRWSHIWGEFQGKIVAGLTMNTATATAKVVDFEAYRARKERSERESAASKVPAFSAMPFPVAWMPVWVVPVFYVVGGLSAGAAYG